MADAVANGVAEVRGLEGIERGVVDILTTGAGRERCNGSVVAGFHCRNDAALLGAYLAHYQSDPAFGMVAAKAAADAGNNRIAHLRLACAGRAMGQGGAWAGMDRGRNPQLCPGKSRAVIALEGSERKAGGVG